MDNVLEFRRWHEAAYEQMPPTDTHVVTSGGLIIPAHSNVLASASPVLENIVFRPRKHWQSERVVPILGVPCDAVVVFLQFLYSSSRTSLSSKEGKEAIEKYGIQLIALSHKYGVEWLKRGCEAGLAQELSAERVVDALRIAKLCDASRLYRRCARLVYKDFPSVQQSEGWRFVQKNDPRLELEMLQYIQDVDQESASSKKNFGTLFVTLVVDLELDGRTNGHHFVDLLWLLLTFFRSNIYFLSIAEKEEKKIYIEKPPPT